MNGSKACPSGQERALSATQSRRFLKIIMRMLKTVLLLILSSFLIGCHSSSEKTSEAQRPRVEGDRIILPEAVLKPVRWRLLRPNYVKAPLST